MSKLKTYQQQVQDVIEKSITRVEEQHKSLAERPFDLAEKLEKEAKAYSVTSIRSKHNDAATSAYEALRTWNKRLGGYAEDLIARFDKEAANAKEGAEKTAAQAKSAAKKPAQKASGAKKTAAKKTQTAAKKTQKAAESATA